MSNRGIRWTLLIVALLAAAGAGSRIVQLEQQIARDAEAARTLAAAAERARLIATDINGTLYAYVAPGQGQAFWTARAAALLDDLQASILRMDGAADLPGASMAESLDAVDRLAAAERRARGHAAQGQARLAGDIIFIEARDLLDTIRQNVAAAGAATAGAAEVRTAAVRREQALWGLGALGLLALVALALTPIRRADPLVVQAPAEAAPAPAAPAPDIDLATAAAVCSDLARVTDTQQIPGLLARAAGALQASGLIVWLATPDGQGLVPALSHGYDPRLFARIGAIPRDANNLTAKAWREAATQASGPIGPSAAAMALPLVGPSGTVGVLSAELAEGREVTPAAAAAATMLAAQLSTLVAAMPAAADVQTPPREAQA